MWTAEEVIKRLLRMRALRDEIMRRMTDSAIAARVGIHKRTVAKMAARHRRYAETVQREVAEALDANDVRAINLADELLRDCSERGRK